MQIENPKRTPRLLLLGSLSLVVVVIALRCVQLLLAVGVRQDAMLVLGGTPIRETYAAGLLRLHPECKVLIASGSEDPCIWLIFDKAGTPKNGVWMEHCSKNTFENLIYAAPILSRWGARRVMLVTDNPQNLRALPMARIILGSKGMWVDEELSPFRGGTESRYPIAFETLLSIFSAAVGQVFDLNCDRVTHLSDVDMKYWYQKGFYCAPQAEVGSHDKPVAPK